MMKVPLYILGFLLRYGPQHGYLLKQYLEHISDFANIKLPTIYYHLEKMEKKGLICASQEKEGKRPEKWVYTITDAGRQTFQKYVQEALDTRYDGEFLFDAALFFSDQLEPQQVLEAIARHTRHLERILHDLTAHKRDILEQQSGWGKLYANVIFRHHEHHFQAELQWLQETASELQRALEEQQKRS